ncbi:putative replicative DNA helicase [Orientia tsutsugamushi str. Karp]|nr:putative replicative DNA helicase [Orientia tsutsugamushi str. Karp]
MTCAGRYLIEIGEKIVTNAYSSTLADLAIIRSKLLNLNYMI